MFHPSYAFFALALTATRISLNAWVSCSLAGHPQEQLPHSTHSMPFNFWNASRSWRFAARISFCGTKNSGHTDTQRPQRMHAVGSISAT